MDSSCAPSPLLQSRKVGQVVPGGPALSGSVQWPLNKSTSPIPAGLCVAPHEEHPEGTGMAAPG